MYAVSPAAAGLWRGLLEAVSARSGVSLQVIEHAAPAPLEDLWKRPDQGAVFMCGLPFSQAEPTPFLVAAPVPAPPEFQDRPCYWSEFVVRIDSASQRIEDTYGKRLALTVPGSQSGCVAALSYFMSLRNKGSAPAERPLYAELIAPTVTPLGALQAVVDGAAEVAPIDSYALRLLRTFRPDLTSQVRSVARTPPTPIPPLVASPAAAAKLEPLQAALLDAHGIAGEKALLDKLLLHRFARPAPATYAVLRQAGQEASRYWHEHVLAETTHPAW